jgi:hypothetical protein
MNIFEFAHSGGPENNIVEVTPDHNKKLLKKGDVVRMFNPNNTFGIYPQFLEENLDEFRKPLWRIVDIEHSKNEPTSMLTIIYLGTKKDLKDKQFKVFPEDFIRVDPLKVVKF